MKNWANLGWKNKVWVLGKTYPTSQMYQYHVNYNINIDTDDSDGETDSIKRKLLKMVPFYP